MAFTKTWIGATGDYSLASNWKPISIINGVYKWTASGSGTGEYYLELAGGGDPSITEPASVQEDGEDLDAATAGSLTAGSWDYGDSDTLGYNTIYVRLADDADPDSKDSGYVTFRQAPVAGDSVVLNEEATGPISSGLDQSGVTLAAFIATAGFSRAVGTASTYLQISCTSFEWSGTAQGYVDLGTSAIDPIVKQTYTPGNGQGLYLLGSALDTVSIEGGSVGIAARPGETSTVDTVRANGTSAVVVVGSGCSLTNGEILKGSVTLRCAATTLRCHGGTLGTLGSGAYTTAHVFAGTFVSSSTGTITTLNANGGISDFIQSGVERTVTNLKHNPGATVIYDPQVLTVTNHTAPDSPVRLTASAAA